jgi:hypothetical protein
MPTASPLFDELYAVGDSMSDSGGIYELSSLALSLIPFNTGLQPIPISEPNGPYAMKFSNGPVLPEITAELLGATLINFSFGGAQALGDNTLLDLAGSLIPPDLLAAIDALPAPVKDPIEAVLNHVIDLPGQLADLTAALLLDPPSPDSALVSLIGLNDFQSLDPKDPLLIDHALATATGIVGANHLVATTAFSLGIGTVIYETLPAISFFPAADAFPALQAIGDAAVDAVNLGLQQDALAFQQKGFDVRVVDIARMADEVSADFGTFGFLNFDVPWSLGDGTTFVPNLPLSALEQTAFFDPLHPTTNLHGVLGVFAAESLTSHTIFRGATDDVITGTTGDDLVLAGAGNDQVSLGRGNDILLGGLGNDVAEGGQDSDLMSGGAGHDRLSGGNGDDVLAGNSGDDWLEGGFGADALIDGLGSDSLFGGAGDDFFFSTLAKLLGGSATDVDHFEGGAGFDTLVVLVDQPTRLVEQPKVPLTLGKTYTIDSMNLTINGIEKIVFTTQFGFDDVTLPGGELGARLHEADLFGFV